MMKPRRLYWARFLALALFFTFASVSPLVAQGSSSDYEENEENVTVSPSLLEGMKFRSINFSRGGRATAVAGVRGRPLIYYMGASGGGVWKTTDGGNHWNNVSDGFFGVGSVGAIAVAESDPNVVYVGTGSACPRGNVSVGDGIYRSSNGGKTWKHVGLRQAGQIGKIRIHPENPDLVYVAVLGQVFGPNEERGVFRSEDGGETWERVLFLSDRTGVVDLSMDVTNPRILYAGAWRAERKPWMMISGSEDGGVFKTTDGGDNWKRLEGGLPTGLIGRTSVAVSPANPNRVWVLIEAEGDGGGVYRTDDGGDSWRRVNGDWNLRQRPWYYIHIIADPKDENTVYVLNASVYKSIDGAKTFDIQIDPPHADNHDLWIHPDDPKTMINANDGGANVSFNGGESWSWQMNQPTAEIYRVFVDDRWPYRVYGSQQDNTTISVPSHGLAAWSPLPPDWYQVGGCESGHIAIDPRDPNVIYAGCTGGKITRIDRAAGKYRQILTYPQMLHGAAARDLKYRFQWNAPIRLSPHDPDVVYHASQVIHRSKDGGQSWEVASPDLTTNNPEQQDYAGGPITHEGTGVEVYNTVFAFEESPHQAGLLWAGSDDGQVHLSRDHGAKWKEVTPKDMPVGGTVNVIDLSAHGAGRAHIAVYRYRENDFRPYIFQTSNFGESWKLLTDGANGIPATHFTRAIREDPDRRGLLYAGTEFGLYISFDDGAHWQRFQNNLPVTPVTDLQVHRKDLVVSTQGRAFWILDDVAPLHQITDAVQKADMHLFEPGVAYRGGYQGGARINYYVGKMPEGEVTLQILDESGEVVRAFKATPSEGADSAALVGGDGASELPLAEGFNMLTWNLRGEALETDIHQHLLEDEMGKAHVAGTPGLAVVPGGYQVRLSVGEWIQTQPLQIEILPGLSTTVEALQEQYDLAAEIAGELKEVYDGVTTLRDIEAQTTGILARIEKAGIEMDGAGEISEAAQAMTAKLSEIEKKMTRGRVIFDTGGSIPPLLDDELVLLYAYVAGGLDPPTAGAYERFNDLKPQVAELMGKLQEVISTDLAAFNEKVRAQNLPPVVVAPVGRPAITEQSGGIHGRHRTDESAQPRSAWPASHVESRGRRS